MSTIEQDPNSQNIKFCKEVAKAVFSVCRITNIYILIAVEWSGVTADTELLMADSTTKRAEDIVVGDELMVSTGLQR